MHTRGATFFELRVVSLYARRVAIICQARHQINDYLLEMCAARYDQAQREAHRAAECVLTDLILTQLASRFVSRLATQQCTQMPQNGTERPFWPICVHSCVPTVVHNSATVYTNAPKRHREAISADLCTLLRHRPGGDAHIAGAVTQPPIHTNSRSFIHKVHRCWMSAYLPLSAGCYGSDSPLLSSSSYRRTRRSACGFLGRA